MKPPKDGWGAIARKLASLDPERFGSKANFKQKRKIKKAVFLAPHVRELFGSVHSQSETDRKNNENNQSD